MISNDTIRQINDLTDIKEVIEDFIPLKKAGASYQACCPFHKEDTPSFSVSPVKGIYKCFGCGASGDAISFLMASQNFDYRGAIYYLAEKYNIELSFTGHEDWEEQKKKEEAKKDFYAVNERASEIFSRLLLSERKDAQQAKDYLINGRKIALESIQEFKLGFAPDERRYLTALLTESDQLEPAVTLGISKVDQDGNSFDQFRNRIIFPILEDRFGKIVGFTGRKLPEVEENKKNPKYLNSSESFLYNKSNILFGLFQAKGPIAKSKTAYLVEGPTDIIALYQNGIYNVVAPCGTAITYEQLQLLAKYASTVILFTDGDQAGYKSAMRAIPMIIEEGLNPYVLQLDENEDPDSLINSLIADHLDGFDPETGDLEPEDPAEIIEDWINENRKEGLQWYASQLLKDVNLDDPTESDEAIEKICEALSFINNPFKVSKFAGLIGKQHGIKEAELVKRAGIICNIRETKVQEYPEDARFSLPESVDRDEFFEHGFYELISGSLTGYYFNVGKKKAENVTNFVLKPLYHIRAPENTRRMLEVTNGFSTKVLEMPSINMLSVEKVTGFLFDQANFFPMAGFTRAHLLKIINKIGAKFQECYELHKLGWQREGFFAFSNSCYNGTLEKYNEYGVVSISGENFLSPSMSKAYDRLREEENPYENDKYLVYTDPIVKLERWIQLFVNTYSQNDNGWIGSVFALASIFMDIITQVAKMPLLYAYGAKGSGKSEYAESITGLYFSGQDSQGYLLKPFNLNQGTDYAFFGRMGRFKGVPMAFNEFDENAIPEEWFRAFKAAHDGEGREKGSGKKDRTTMQRVYCTIILIGQFLSSKDDNSILSRSIPRAFKEDRSRPQEMIDSFNELKELESKGLSGCLVELLSHRNFIKEKYPETFHATFKQLNEDLKSKGYQVMTRTVKNMSVLIAMHRLLSQKINFPFSADNFYEHCRESAIEVSGIENQSNALSDFWKTMEFLLDREEITEGLDFKFETRMDVKVLVGSDSFQTKNFAEPTKLLFLRLTNIHKLYAKEQRSVTGKNGLNEQTISMYLKDQEYFIGTNPGSKFLNHQGKRSSTSSMVINYEKLKGVNLERTADEEIQEAAIEGILTKDAEIVDVLGVPKVKFTISKTEQYEYQGYMVNRAVTTSCLCSDLSFGKILKSGMNVSLQGMLNERIIPDKNGEGVRTFRSMNVITLAIKPLVTVTDFKDEVPEGEVNF